jgi:putative copper resistance protein D
VAFYFAGRTKTFSLKRANFLSGIVLIFAACLLLSLAWAGHAVAGVHDRALHLFVDVVHLLIGAIWPMGLIPLIWFLRHIETQQSAGVAESEIAVLRRSSRLSFIAVLLLVGTGTVNGWLMIGSWTALVTTLYGGLLLGKVFIVGVMIGLGAFNRCRLLPRIPNAPQTIRRLRQTVFAECCLILIVLVIVGIMGMTSPPS